jgi:hypothetical protein
MTIQTTKQEALHIADLIFMISFFHPNQFSGPAAIANIPCPALVSSSSLASFDDPRETKEDYAEGNPSKDWQTR